MEIYLLHPLHTFVFASILVAIIPKEHIHRLSIYGIIFGGIMDITMLTFGQLTGLFGWINYGPFGFVGIPFFAPISWSIFFILFFYFLPSKKYLKFIYTAAAILFSIIYTNVVISLNIFWSYSQIVIPSIAFTIWFSIALWGFNKINRTLQK